LSYGEAGRVTRRLDAVQQLYRQVCCSIFGANLFTLLFRLSSQSAFGTQCPGLGRRPPASVQRCKCVPSAIGTRLDATSTWCSSYAIKAAPRHQSRVGVLLHCRPTFWTLEGVCFRRELRLGRWTAHVKVSYPAMPCNIFFYSIFPHFQCSVSVNRCVGWRRRPPASVQRCLCVPSANGTRLDATRQSIRLCKTQILHAVDTRQHYQTFEAQIFIIQIHLFTQLCKLFHRARPSPSVLAGVQP
jgi:hypothetical protein